MLPFQILRVQRPDSLPKFATLAWVLFSLACDDPAGLEIAGLDHNRALWEAQRLDDYSYEVVRVCFCLYREVRLTVTDGVLTHGVDLATEGALGQEELEGYPTIDGLFDLLDDARERDAHSVRVEFHATRGHPTTLFIDYTENVADEELGYTLLSEVEALPG